MTAIPAFHEVQFPTDISAGATGGASWNTTVNEFTDGAEKRNQNWSRPKGRWEVSHAVKTPAQMAALIHFWWARRGRAYGFRFKDWTDYRLPFWDRTPGDIDAIPTLFTTTGSTQTFQLAKVYGDNVSTVTRNIIKPVASSLVLTYLGTPLTLTTDYTLDATTGIVTLSSAYYSTTGHAIKGYCEFDVPARFDTDDQDIAARIATLQDWGSIPIKEIRPY